MTPEGLIGLEDLSAPPWWLPKFCQLTPVLEILLIVGLAALMGSIRMVRGCVLMICMGLNATSLLIIRGKCAIVFKKAKDMALDRQNTVSGGAALDVQILTPSWNSSHLDVLCGYSSQLHSLTNLAVDVTNPRMIPMCCRFLAVVLAVQAAILASLLCASGINAITSTIWLGVYVLMLVPPEVIRRKYSSSVVQRQPGAVNSAKTFIFSSRRSAHIFIAMLPVSSKTSRWDWLDVFMPNNQRRKE